MTFGACHEYPALAIRRESIAAARVLMIIAASGIIEVGRHFDPDALEQHILYWHQPNLLERLFILGWLS